MFDVCAIGELIVDCTPAGSSTEVQPVFACYPGGAPSNVAACVAKLGMTSGYIGVVGDDHFGRFLLQRLKNVGVSTEGIFSTPDYNTTLAFVHLNEVGDRSFSFYRKPGADIMLEREMIDYSMITEAKIFHFGSVSMTDDPSRDATLYAAEYAKKHNITVSYDPNLRLNLWNSEEEAKECIKKGLAFADIVKISEEELVFLTQDSDYVEGARRLIGEYGIKVVFVTLGNKGAMYVTDSASFYLPTFDVPVKDTNGAGDAFTGGLLYSIISKGKKLDALTEEEWKDILNFANAVGALTTMNSGAIPALPSLAEVNECIRNTPYVDCQL